MANENHFLSIPGKMLWAACRREKPVRVFFNGLDTLRKLFNIAFVRFNVENKRVASYFVDVLLIPSEHFVTGEEK